MYELYFAAGVVIDMRKIPSVSSGCKRGLSNLTHRRRNIGQVQLHLKTNLSYRFSEMIFLLPGPDICALPRVFDN